MRDEEPDGASVEDGKPLTASEMGKRGAAVRWDPQRRAKRPQLAVLNKLPQKRTIRGIARQIHRAIEEQLIGDAIVPWHSHPRLRGPSVEDYIDLHWPPRLVQEWTQLLDLAKAQRDLALVKDILMAMTALTRLNPVRLKQVATDTLSLPSNVDLSRVSDEMLEKIIGKSLSSVEPKSI